MLEVFRIPLLELQRDTAPHYSVVIDPSHGTGYANLVEPMALAAAACGADGLIIEVHNNPEKALCDGAQSIRPEIFGGLMKKVKKIREAMKG